MMIRSRSTGRLFVSHVLKPRHHSIRRGFSTENTVSAPKGACFTELNKRGVIELSGPDACDFLQGLVTNNVHDLKAEKDGMYAGFLNPKGRMLAETIIHRAAEDVYFLDVDRSLLPKLVKYLKLMKLRKNIDITDASEVYKVYSVMGPSNLSSCFEELQKVPAGTVIPDPRFEGMGFRLFLSPKKQEESETLLKELGIAKTKSSSTYEKMRMLHGIAEGPEVEGSIPLEFNLEKLNGVCFTKGCYTGQELTARTHFQGLVRKRVLPVHVHHSSAQLESISSLKPDPVEAALFVEHDFLLHRTSPLVESDGGETQFPIDLQQGVGSAESSNSGRSPGKLLAMAPKSCIGLALLRLQDNMETEFRRPNAFQLQHKESTLSVSVVHLPLWWDKTIE